MARLTDQRKRSMCLADFQQYPVWVWDDGMDYLCPIEDPWNEADQYGDCFIRARFTAPGGQRFDGYLVDGGEVFAFGLFVPGKECVFNLNMPPNILQQSLRKLYQSLGRNPFPLFPLHYESDVRLKDTPRIEGNLTFDTPQGQDADES